MADKKKKRSYRKPEITEYALDNEISLMMTSEPGEGMPEFESAASPSTIESKSIFNNEDELLPDKPKY